MSPCARQDRRCTLLILHIERYRTTSQPSAHALELIEALTSANVMTFTDCNYQGTGGAVRTPFNRHRRRQRLSCGKKAIKNERFSTTVGQVLDVVQARMKGTIALARRGSSAVCAADARS